MRDRNFEYSETSAIRKDGEFRPEAIWEGFDIVENLIYHGLPNQPETTIHVLEWDARNGLYEHVESTGKKNPMKGLVPLHLPPDYHVELLCVRPQLPKVARIILAVRVSEEDPWALDGSQRITYRASIALSTAIGEKPDLISSGEGLKDTIGSVGAPILTN
jgi:hypothetical protein